MMSEWVSVWVSEWVSVLVNIYEKKIDQEMKSKSIAFLHIYKV